MSELNNLDALQNEVILDKPIKHQHCADCLHSCLYDSWFYCSHEINEGMTMGVDEVIYSYLSANRKKLTEETETNITPFEIGSYCKLFEGDF